MSETNLDPILKYLEDENHFPDATEQDQLKTIVDENQEIIGKRLVPLLKLAISCRILSEQDSVFGISFLTYHVAKLIKESSKTVASTP